MWTGDLKSQRFAASELPVSGLAAGWVLSKCLYALASAKNHFMFQQLHPDILSSCILQLNINTFSRFKRAKKQSLKNKKPVDSRELDGSSLSSYKIKESLGAALSTQNWK